MSENYFKNLIWLRCIVREKGTWNYRFKYISWAEAWEILKKQHPEATYRVYEDKNWEPFFETKIWFDVKVWVKVNWGKEIGSQNLRSTRSEEKSQLETDQQKILNSQFYILN